jgi:hypothetical protein
MNIYPIKRSYGYIIYGPGKLSILNLALFDIIGVIGKIKYAGSTNSYQFYPKSNCNFSSSDLAYISNFMTEIETKEVMLK